MQNANQYPILTNNIMTLLIKMIYLLLDPDPQVNTSIKVVFPKERKGQLIL